MRIASLPFVKIGCISSVEEARLAISLGASALGLGSSMPSGPGVIGDELIASIAAVVPPPVATFLLTSRQATLSVRRARRSSSRCSGSCAARRALDRARQDDFVQRGIEWRKRRGTRAEAR